MGLSGDCRHGSPRQRRLIAIGGVHVIDDLALVPDVIAGSDDVDAELEQLLGDLRRNAEAAGGVFTVRDGEVDRVLLLELRQALMDDGAAGTAEYVSYKKYSQW